MNYPRGLNVGLQLKGYPGINHIEMSSPMSTAAASCSTTTTSITTSMPSTIVPLMVNHHSNQPSTTLQYPGHHLAGAPLAGITSHHLHHHHHQQQPHHQSHQHQQPQAHHHQQHFGTTIPNRIFVGGLSSDTTEAELQELFSAYGNVTAVKIINDKSGVPKGVYRYGFITFQTEEEARRALKECDNLHLKGKKLNVAIAIKKQQIRLDGLSLVANGPLMYPAVDAFQLAGIPNEGGHPYSLGWEAAAIHGTPSPANSLYNYIYPYTIYSAPSLPFLQHPCSTYPSAGPPHFPPLTTHVGPPPHSVSGPTPVPGHHGSSSAAAAAAAAGLGPPTSYHPSSTTTQYYAAAAAAALAAANNGSLPLLPIASANSVNALGNQLRWVPPHPQALNGVIPLVNDPTLGGLNK